MGDSNVCSSISFFSKIIQKLKPLAPFQVLAILVGNLFLVQLYPQYFQEVEIYRSTTGKFLMLRSQTVFKWDSANQSILTIVKDSTIC